MLGNWERRDEKSTRSVAFYSMTFDANYSFISGPIGLQLAQVRAQYESCLRCKFHQDRKKLPKSDQFLGTAPLASKPDFGQIDGSKKVEFEPGSDSYESKGLKSELIFGI